MADGDEAIGSSFISALFKPAALLPVAQHRERLLYLVETFPVTIVVGHTGSGKTTQIPQFLLQAGWCDDGKQIAVTQVGQLKIEAFEFMSANPSTKKPRRVAATTVAIRVAEEMRCKLGQEVCARIQTLSL